MLSPPTFPSFALFTHPSDHECLPRFTTRLPDISAMSTNALRETETMSPLTLDGGPASSQEPVKPQAKRLRQASPPPPSPPLPITALLQPASTSTLVQPSLTVALALSTPVPTNPPPLLAGPCVCACHPLYTADTLRPILKARVVQSSEEDIRAVINVTSKGAIDVRGIQEPFRYSAFAYVGNPVMGYAMVLRDSRTYSKRVRYNLCATLNTLFNVQTPALYATCSLFFQYRTDTMDPVWIELQGVSDYKIEQCQRKRLYMKIMQAAKEALEATNEASDDEDEKLDTPKGVLGPHHVASLHVLRDQVCRLALGERAQLQSYVSAFLLQKRLSMLALLKGVIEERIWRVDANASLFPNVRHILQQYIETMGSYLQLTNEHLIVFESILHM